MRSLFCFLFAALIFTACNKSAIENNRTELRIFNNTSSMFDSVIVNSPGGKQVYQQIAAGSFSAYKPYSFIYRYASIEVYYNNRKLQLQPVDYVGEQKLTPGKYTYQLGIMFTLQDFLLLECKKD